MPPGEIAAAFAAGVLVGSIAPTYYAAERLRGTGRALLGRLPYRPPPGQDEEEAMQEAAEEAGAKGPRDN